MTMQCITDRRTERKCQIAGTPEEKLLYAIFNEPPTDASCGQACASHTGSKASFTAPSAAIVGKNAGTTFGTGSSNGNFE